MMQKHTSYILSCMPNLPSVTFSRIDMREDNNNFEIQDFKTFHDFNMHHSKIDAFSLLKLLASMPFLRTLTLEDVAIEWVLDTQISAICQELQGCSNICEDMRKRIRELAVKKLPTHTNVEEFQALLEYNRFDFGLLYQRDLTDETPSFIHGYDASSDEDDDDDYDSN